MDIYIGGVLKIHRIFKNLLKDALGKSEFIIAVNLDIRDFSSFSKKVESPETAMFIKKVYMKLIDNYFSDASFFKPTGDGLLITIPYTEQNLSVIARRTIKSCFKVLKEFGTFCKNDSMINFEVPQKIGIGLSRGTACRLVSKKKTLDYSGSVLNLASRLMDLARPTGIVFDSNFGLELLSDEHKKLFVKEGLYIKGIAEKRTIDVYYTKNMTDISPLNKYPMDKTKWKTIEDTKTLGKIMKSELFGYNLETEPLDPNEIKVKIKHSGVIKGKKQGGYVSTFNFPHFKYYLEAGKPTMSVEFGTLAEQLKNYGVKSSWNIDIEISYPER